jgi:hypothetical protein
MLHNQLLSFLVLGFLCVDVQAGMAVQVWWVDPSNRTYRGWNSTPCRLQYAPVYSEKYTLAAMLTLSFGREDGMVSDQIDFINLIARKIGDSLGISILVPAGNTQYLAQYGKETGILGDLKFKCYSLNDKEKRPILYDTQTVQSVWYDTVTVKEKRFVDSVIYSYDTVQVNKTIADTQHVVVPIYYPKKLPNNNKRTFWEFFLGGVAVTLIAIETVFLFVKP